MLKGLIHDHFMFLLQFLILVIDSTDRERLAITKAELYQMLANEVSIRR